MKLVAIFTLAFFVFACSYTKEVGSLTDKKLCENLAKFHLDRNKKGFDLTMAEANKRNVDKAECGKTASDTANQLAPDYKLKYCQHLAVYHHHGDYPNFKTTLDKITLLGFADEECNTMASFYLRRMANKKEKSERISNAIYRAQASTKGTSLNPLVIKIQ